MDELQRCYPMSRSPWREAIGRPRQSEAELVYAVARAASMRPLEVLRALYAHLEDPPEDVEGFCRREANRLKQQMFVRRTT